MITRDYLAVVPGKNNESCVHLSADKRPVIFPTDNLLRVRPMDRL